ncbi:carbohydrate kinase family protein [Thermosipho melanesiensis]|uniref:PfkB domain protein n=3 Tax=Thermosipho melanesiensis TaxID=46541 RepID=A6LKF0_THEM4|nr:PfkB family carbohydrate kinase [Thermosipho melanesiensis]ABR30401.1 PfkB domain protein [Thermosipho melanesiensis BI429]APT73562.1 ribokinase [Thermosipho melanesiensis]
MIAFIGESLVDLISSDGENFTKRIGGSPLNIARNLNQFNIKTVVISRVGNDFFGKEIIQTLEGENIKTNYIQVGSGNTSTVIVFASKGTPDFIPYRDEDMNLEIPNLDFEKFEFIHLSCWAITNGIEKIKHILTKTKIAFDPNCRKKIFPCKKINLDFVYEVLKNTFIVKPSLDDAREIFGPLPRTRYIELLHDFGIKYVILTMGEEGALVSDGKKIEHIKIPAKKVVDTTGAGDAFWSGIYYGLLNNFSIFKAALFGTIISLHVIGEVGGVVKLKDISEYLEEVERYENSVL